PEQAAGPATASARLVGPARPRVHPAGVAGRRRAGHRPRGRGGVGTGVGSVASGAHVASRGDTAPADRGARPLSGASALPTAMAALVAAVLSVVLAYAVVAMPL